jgi:replicative DNA helicase
VIAAMPGAGKTTQVINTIINNCVKGDNPMLFFSVEMPAVEIMTNIIANISEINSRALRMGDVDDGNILSINSVRGRLKDNFEIDDKGGITWQYIEAKIKAFKRKHNVQGRVLVAIDYLQLMGNSDDEKRLPKEERIETICNELTRICKDLNVHLILLSQFSREASKREGARPKMTDLKGSGAIEANAVSILLQWRPEYHGIFTDEQGNDLRGLCEINIAKGRYVNPEPVYVRFIGKYSKFDDYKKEDNSPAPF